MNPSNSITSRPRLIRVLPRRFPGLAGGLLQALVLALALSSCVGIQRARGVTIASDPPGARVLIDGKDSGFVTPTALDLDRETQRIDLVLEGYDTATRVVRTDSNWSTVHYDEMYIYSNTWRFPLWLNWRDGLVPFRQHKGFSPERLFVRLRLSGEQPFDEAEPDLPEAANAPASAPDLE